MWIYALFIIDSDACYSSWLSHVMPGLAKLDKHNYPLITCTESCYIFRRLSLCVLEIFSPFFLVISYFGVAIFEGKWIEGSYIIFFLKYLFSRLNMLLFIRHTGDQLIMCWLA